MNHVLTYILLSLSLLSLTQANAAEIAMTQMQQQSLGVSVAQVSKNAVFSSQRFSAEVVVPAGQMRMVSAPQSGLLDQLYVTAGQQVKKGQVIAHLTSPDLLNLQRDYLQAQTQKKLAAKSLARDAELLKDGIIPQRRYLETESAHEETLATLAQRKQALRLAGMGDEAIHRLNPNSGMSSGISIVAPMTGQVLEQLVTTGQRVEMAMPLYKIAQLSPLWLEIHAPLEGLPKLQTGMLVQVPKVQAEGRLIAVIRNVNKADQTLLLRAEITKGAEQLSPGQFVEAEINLSGTQAAHFSVPKSALARQGSQAIIFVQTKQGFKPISVKIISEQGDDAMIDATLSGNEKVAVTGITAIKGAWLGLGSE